ncbi:MAG: ribonuclease HII [Aggregatilineales bacterium]
MSTLCGLDEAGRGPLAGPIVAAAVVFQPDFDFAARFPRIAFGDSKKLTARQREVAYELIVAHAVVCEIETIDVPDINAKNIGWANRAIFERLIVRVAADRYVVDGNLKLAVPPDKRAAVRSMIRADQTEPAVSAASIVAKVSRDRRMRELHAECPEYGWDHNMGYHSASHVAAIRQYGQSPYHRTKFVETVFLHKSLPLFAPFADAAMGSTDTSLGPQNRPAPATVQRSSRRGHE